MPTHADYLDAGSTNKLADTYIELNPADSGLCIAAYQGEEAILSGGIELSELKWRTAPHLPQVHVTTLTPTQSALLPAGGVTSLRVAGRRATRARFPNANPEIDLFPKGYVTAKTTWLAPVYPPNSPESKPCKDPDGTLCGPSKTLTIPVDGKEWHGMYQVALLSPPLPVLPAVLWFRLALPTGDISNWYSNKRDYAMRAVCRTLLSVMAARVKSTTHLSLPGALRTFTLFGSSKAAERCISPIPESCASCCSYTALAPSIRTPAAILNEC